MPLQINEFVAGNGQGGVSARGDVATRMMQSGFNVNSLRPSLPDDDESAGLRSNATLRNREWILFDTAVINIARRRLVGVADLISHGLTYPVADALGVTRI